MATVSQRRRAIAAHRKTKEQQLAEAYAYRKRQQEQAAREAEKKKSDAGVLERSAHTALDITGNVLSGAGKGVEGIVDLLISGVGAVGGLFSDDFEQGAKNAVQYDATGALYGNALQDLSKHSYLNDSKTGEFIENVAEGVGNLLPAVAVGIATAGASTAAQLSAQAVQTASRAASLATVAASAAGQSTEEAYNDGADYYSGLGYGVASGVAEAGTEALFGMKGMGKGVLDNATKGVAKQGFKRIAKEAAEEGVEEMVAEAANPILKTTYKGTDALSEYKNPEFYRQIVRAGAVGSLTGAAYTQSVGRIITVAQGGNDDINASIESVNDLKEYRADLQAEGKLTPEKYSSIQSKIKKNFENVEKVLKKASPEKRAKLIANYRFDGAFDENGSLAPEFSASLDYGVSGGESIDSEEKGSQRQFSRFVDASLWNQPESVDEDLRRINEDRSEGDAEITVFDGELSEMGERSYSELRQATRNLNKKAGENFNVSIVNGGAGFNGVTVRGRNIYISADVLEDGTWGKTLVHELTHFTEGSRKYVEFMKYLMSDEKSTVRKMQELTEEGNPYGFTRENAERLARIGEGNISQNTETIRYSKMNNKSFEENVKQIITMPDTVAKKRIEEMNYVSVMSNTPKVILDNVTAAENLEIIIRFDALYLATRKDGVAQGHYHDLGLDIVSELPTLISNPDAIVRLDNGRINVLAKMLNENNSEGIISIELNTVKDVNSKHDKYNLIVSAFNAKNNYLKNLITKRGVKVEYKKEDLSQVNHQLYEWLASINDKSSDNSISESSENVNRNSEKNISADFDSKLKIQYSKNKDFAKEIEEWNGYGRPENGSFILGTAGDVLQGLGAIESDIYMQSDKINTILREHPEMTLNEIKKIPDMLEDPVLILKSKNVGRGGKANTRLVIFGSVKAKNGQPVLSVLDLRPNEKNLIIDDMQKLTPAYTKTQNGVEFIRNSDVVYADKKRTTPLLRTIGFQAPIELNESGYIGSISYKGQNVNIFGEKFSEIVRENTTRVQINIGETNGVDKDTQLQYNKKRKRTYKQISKQEYAIINSRIMEYNSKFLKTNDDIPKYGTANSYDYFYVYENFSIGSFGILKSIKISDENRPYISQIKAIIGESNEKRVDGSTEDLNEIFSIVKAERRNYNNDNADDSRRGADSTNVRVPHEQYKGNGIGNNRESFGDSRRDLKRDNDYTMEEYESFGWARAVGGITYNELDDLYSKIQACKSLSNFARSDEGEYIIEVNDDPHRYLEADNVFVFIKGRKNAFRIKKTIRFAVESQTEMEIIKEILYEGRTCRNTYISLIKEQGIAREYRRKDTSTFDEYKRSATNRETSGRTDSNYRRFEEYRVGYPFVFGEYREVNADNTSDHQKKRNAETLLMQNAHSNTSKTQVGQTSNSSIPESSENVNSNSEKNVSADFDSKLKIQYSKNKDFAKEIEEWNGYGRPENGSFILGTTGDVLQGLGAIESDIYMQSDKINTILREHPEMTLNEIKKIPDMLEDPVLILKSKNVGRGGKANTRLVIFGSVKAKNGQPVLSVLDLRPNEKNLIIDDMQKLTSAYTKTQNGVEFIRNSDVVYADKKRTASLLTSIGFQAPIELLQSGYIGSISYFKLSVNIFGEKFSEIVRENTTRVQVEKATTSVTTEPVADNGDSNSEKNISADFDSDTKSAEINASDMSFVSELVAGIAEDSVGMDEVFIEKLVRGNSNLAAKIINGIRDAAASFERRKSFESNREYTRLKRAEKLFMSAVKNAGMRYYDGKIIGANEEEEEQSEKATQYSIKHPKFSEEEIKNNIIEVSSMESVKSIDEIKLERTGVRPSDIYTSFFESLGGNIYSDVFGDISMKKSSVKSEIRHGNTAEKIAAIEAIPNVINEGKVIHCNEKQAGVERIVVAAPINIGKKDYIMGVMLQRDAQNQRLYLHNVAIKEEGTPHSKVDLLTTGTYENDDRLFITSILQKVLNVNTIFEKNKSEIIDKKRVTEWEKRTGLRLPVGNSLDNSTDSISENESKVNTNPEKSLQYSKKTSGVIRKSTSDAERYELLKNKAIPLTARTDMEKFDAVRNKLGISEDDVEFSKYGDRVRLFKKLGEEFSVFHDYANRDIRLGFSFSKENMRESVSKQRKNYINLAKMLTCFDKVIDNAVGIEVHNRNAEGYKADNSLNNVYVLASAFKDGNNIVLVKLEVKEFSDKENTLHVAIALESIKTDGIVKQEVAENGVARQVSPPSDISIAHYFEKINPADEDFLKYVPDGFLTTEQLQAKRRALIKEDKKYGRDIKNGSQVTQEFDEITPNSTSKTSLASPITADNSISENESKVNTNPEKSLSYSKKSAEQGTKNIDNYTESKYNIDASDDEIYALLAYKSSESYKINAKLRHAMELDEYERYIVKHLDSVLGKLPVYKGIVYRNIGFDTQEELDAAVEEYENNPFKKPLQYISSSTDKDGYILEKPFVATLIMRSVNGRDIGGFGNNFESEILFPRNSRFEVNKINYSNKANPIIYLTERYYGKETYDRRRAYSHDYRGRQNGSGIAPYDSAAMQSLQASELGISTVQVLSGRDTDRNSLKSGDLREVRGNAERASSEDRILTDNRISENESKVNTNPEKILQYSKKTSGVIRKSTPDSRRAEILRRKVINDIPYVDEIPENILSRFRDINGWESINKEFKNHWALRQAIAREFGVDLGIEFTLTGKSFKDTDRNRRLAKMLSVFDTVINNAVGIEIHSREGYKTDPTLKNVYVLMSAFGDGDSLIPVKLEVKEYDGKKTVAIALESIKKTEVSKQGTTENGVAQSSRSVSISITDLMKNVKPQNTEFTKYFPSELLTDAQSKRLRSEAQSKAEKLERMREDEKDARSKIGKLEDENEKLASNIYRGDEYDKVKSENKYLMEKIVEAKIGAYMHASRHQEHIFSQGFEKITKRYWRGMAREDDAVRVIFSNIWQWYVNPKNMLFHNEDGEKTRSFSEDMTDIMEYLATGEGDFSLEELKRMNILLEYIRHNIENYNQVFINGKRIPAQDVAKECMAVIDYNKKIKSGILTVFQQSSVYRVIGEPRAFVEAFDKYDPNGFATQSFNAFNKAEVEANVMEMQLWENMNVFFKEHKGYEKRLVEGKIDFRGEQIPLEHAITLYMLHKTEDAWNALVRTGGFFEDRKRNRKEFLGISPAHPARYNDYIWDKYDLHRLKPLIEKQKKSLYNQFSDDDKSFMKTVEDIFKQCGTHKEFTDYIIKGFTNVMKEGYYFPKYRADKFERIDVYQEVDSARNMSFNKNTRNSSNRLLVLPITDVVRRHVHGIAIYSACAPVIENYNRILNVDINNDMIRPRSIRSELNNTAEGKKVLQYFRELKEDIEGTRIRRDEGWRKAVAYVERGWATYNVGLNPKVIVSQTMSYVAAGHILSFSSLAKGLNLAISGADVDKYCLLAKMRNTDDTVIKAYTVLDNVGRFGSVATFGISQMDRLVICRLFVAAQAHVEQHGGAKIGTEENKVAAGKLLEKVILETQQNSLKTERSAAMRSQSELLHASTMFTGDSMKNFGRAVNGIGRFATLKERKRLQRFELHSDAESKRSLTDKELKKAQRESVRSVATVMATAILTVAIGLFFKWIYGKLDDKEIEEIIDDMKVDFFGTLIGGLPIIRDVYSYFFEGYDVDTFMVSVTNDMLLGIKEVTDCGVALLEGKEVSRQKINSSIRKMFYAGGQVFGIPVRNTYNIVQGVTHTISPETHYTIDSWFYNKSYSSDLKDAIEKDDEKMMSTITGLMLNERGGDYSSSASKALSSLLKQGKSVLPRSIGDSVTYNKETVELDRDQKKKIKSIYGKADSMVNSLVRLNSFQSADSEAQAYAISFINNLYYQMALEEVLGDGEKSKHALFAVAIDAHVLAIILAIAKDIEADKDLNGKPISGSRKKKIEAYVDSQALTAAQKHILMGALGYRNLKGEDKVRSYVEGLNLTAEEKATLMDISGYDA